MSPITAPTIGPIGGEREPGGPSAGSLGVVGLSE